MTLDSPAFDLPDRLAAKRSEQLIGGDATHFARIADALAAERSELEIRLDELRRAPAGEGQAALERDQEIHRLTARLRLVRRIGIDVCLGRMVASDDREPVYIGRLGLSDSAGERLLIDWRAPAAEPFFAATRARPRGLVSRRRYRWTRGRVSDYWDEGFGAEPISPAALDDQSAFIASLGASRSARMRDVLGTIQADQDAIIRAGSRGALVVDGGPGTGKTVVALHRTAALLYSDPLLSPRRGGVLFVGPSAAYLAYVEGVLPGLGEESVQVATLRDLVEEGAAALPEPTPELARLKGSSLMTSAIESAVRHYERPPRDELAIETEWGEVRLGPEHWAEAFDAIDASTAHNEAREQLWTAIVEIATELLGEEEAPPHLVRRALERDEELGRAVTRAWPLLDPAGVVADLYSVPSYLRRCAPGLGEDEVAALQRAEPRSWTIADLPLLDAARQRIGDPEATRRRRRREAAAAAERERRQSVLDELIASDDSEMRVMSMLGAQDARNSLDDEAALPSLDPDLLAGPFAHVVVDEAQELSDAEWLMLVRRCPSRSFTVVGDRAQSRSDFAESWQERLTRAGIREVRIASLGINYRTPAEVMAEAEPVIRAVRPDANVPTSVRESGIPVRRAALGERDMILDAWIASHPDGIACVIGDESFTPRPRVRSLTSESAKGLEFDLVLLLGPGRPADDSGERIAQAVDRYVAMTRATRELVLLDGARSSRSRS